MKGIIIKGIGGFYYVKTPPEGTVHQCKARGVFKKQGITPMVGDDVEIELSENSDAVITDIFPRRNHFIRPPISNVDCFCVIFSFKHPEPNRAVMDKFLVMAEASNTDVVLCMNKVDLAKAEEIQNIQNVYGSIYPIVYICGRTGEGIDILKDLIKGSKAALAGPSGVGKSTILNLLLPEAGAEIGEISKKTSRGKHTTRHVEIFDAGDRTFIFDTPGFTSFDVLDAEPEDLQHLYPEMANLIGKCRFDDCTHMEEPGCSVREAVERGAISESRYASYREQMEELKLRLKNKY